METKHKANLALLALIAAGLLGGPMEIQAQEPEPENFAWITNTDGLKWKKKIYNGSEPEFLDHIIGYLADNAIAFAEDGLTPEEINAKALEEAARIWRVLHFDPSEKQEIAQIVVPAPSLIVSINVNGCVNLTNIVIHDYGDIDVSEDSIIFPIQARNSGLSNITCTKAMRTVIRLDLGDDGRGWRPIQWTEIEPHKIKIKMHTTDYGQEVEVISEEGTLQIADAIHGEWRDHIGNSPLRFQLWFHKDKFSA